MASKKLIVLRTNPQINPYFSEGCAKHHFVLLRKT